MNRLVRNATDAVSDVQDGATIMMGGFGLCGIPENLIAVLSRKDVKHLTVISNNVGVDDFGIGLLLRTGQVRKVIASYVGANKLFEQLALAGKLEVELVPQGTLVERIRAGGAGIGGFYTPTGYGTPIAEGKECQEFEGRMYVLERPLKADFAFIKAWRGDKWGNLIYRKTARNFNPIMATAATTTIAEVEEFLGDDALESNSIQTPGIFVNRIFQGEHYEKRIESLVVRKAGL